MKNWKHYTYIRFFVIIIFIVTLVACNNGNDTTHTHKWSDWVETTSATCTTEGLRTRVCALDGTIETETIPIDTTAHDYNYVKGSGTSPTCTEDGEGIEICSYNSNHTRSGVIPKLGHSFVWETTTSSTCIDEGEETGTCGHDGITTITRSIPIDPDAHQWRYLTGKVPTCTEDGNGTRKCELCDISETVDVFPALGHEYGNWTQTTAPTCTTAGIETGTCRHDNMTTTTRTGANIDPNAHDWVIQTIAPTFISPGKETEICIHNPSHTNRTTIIDTLPITTTAEWNTALSQLNGKTGSYTLNINGDIGVTSGSFGTTSSNSNLSVTLKGSGKLYLTNQGSIIWVTSRQMLIIDSEDIVLEGLTNGKNGATRNNNAPVVYISGGGTMELRSGTITGNTSTSNGGGVSMNVGTLTMHGGEISGNTAPGGGGVYLYVISTLTMNGGKISGNNATSDYGGGVYLGNYDSVFTMNYGEISGNTANSIGGGVYVDSSGTFTMYGGEISGNDATIGYGGGVHINNNGTFIMYDGTICGNTANIFGGGVNVFNNGTFTLYNGIISGNTSNTYGGGVCVNRGIFTMYSGEIYGNTAPDGGGVYVYSLSSSSFSTFRIITGTIYGSGETDADIRNTAINGSALYVENSSVAQYGILNGSLWIDNGNLTTTNNTIRVVNGELQH